jgi:histidinol-phosphate aminotransferase
MRDEIVTFSSARTATAARERRLHRNECLLGPPRSAVRRLSAAAQRVHVYPTGVYERATRAVAEYFGVGPKQVLLTTGVDEATDLCLLVARRAHVFTPGFDGFADRAGALGRPLVVQRLDERLEIPATTLETIAPGDVVFVASPSNPTGHRFRDAVLRSLIALRATVMLDETYADFASNAPGLRWLGRNPRFVVFRSFSKAFGLAGLRIGCLVGPAEIVGELGSRKPFYSVDSLALEAVCGVLEEDRDFPRRLAEATCRLRSQLAGRLRALPLFDSVSDTEANFVLARCGEDAQARWLAAVLASDFGILVAYTGQFGLPGGLRITVGQEDDNEALLAALEHVAYVSPDILRRGSGQDEGKRAFSQ